MSKKLILGSVGAAALMASVSAFGGNPGQGSTTTAIGIEELRELCHQHRNHEQIREGAVYFKCRMEREFWRHTGSKPVCLPNEGNLCVKAHIKDQRYSTDWWAVPYGINGQTGQCEEYEQWKAITVYSEPGTCDLLDRIVAAGSEDAYCQNVLRESGKADSQDQAIAQIQQTPDQMDQIVQGAADSIFERTGQVRKCDNQCPAPEQSSTSSSSDTIQQPTQTSDSSSDSSTSSVSSSDQVVQAPVCGANVKATTIKKNFWHQKHKVVMIVDEPAESSSLQKLGLHANDYVSKINGKRVRTAQDLDQVLRQSKGRVTVKFMRQGRMQEQTRAI